MADVPPRLAFARSKIALSSLFADLKAPAIERVRIENTMTGKDTIVMALGGEIDRIDQFQFDYFEVVAVSPNMVGASPVEVVDDEVYGWGAYDEPRPSSHLVERLTWDASPFERPSLGRRMLLVNFELDLEERELERARGRVRRALGGGAPVWQGRSFSAYCFTDNAAPDAIIEPLYKLLDRDDIEDYLLVQPTDMVVVDKSGLSPLEDWMSGGYRRHGKRSATRQRHASHKSARSGAR